MKRVKVKALMIISVITGCLLGSTFSNADSLIIRFSSGKTQQVTLEESADDVMNIQAQTTGIENPETGGKAHFRELYNDEITRNGSDAAEDKKATTGKKNSNHLKWGAPKLGE
jgi:hypothetical protein